MALMLRVQKRSCSVMKVIRILVHLLFGAVEKMALGYLMGFVQVVITI